MIVSIDEMMGDCDFFLIVVVFDFFILLDMVIDWIGGLCGVYGLCSVLVILVVIGLNFWCIDVLSKMEKIFVRGFD